LSLFDDDLFNNFQEKHNTPAAPPPVSPTSTSNVLLGSLELKESGVVTRSGGSELEQDKSPNQSCRNLVDLPEKSPVQLKSTTSRPQGCWSGLNRLKLSKTAGRPINKGTSSESERLEEEGDVQNSSNDEMEPVVVDPEVSLS
jgi:hypothetical protein